MKILNILFLLIAMLFSSSSLFAHDFGYKRVYFNIISEEDRTVEVTYKGTSYYQIEEYTGDVIIPETATYNGSIYEVIGIGFGAFADCKGVTSVEIPNSVTYLGYKSFANCTGLKDFDFGGSIISIGELAFDGAGLTSIDIKENIQVIEERAFHNCQGITSLTIPNTLNEIGEYAFENCNNLNSVFVDCETIGNWLNSIPSITNIKIGGNVKTLGDDSFCDMSGITSIEIPENVTSIGKWAFCACPFLKTIVIPNSVTSIGSHSFSNNYRLTSVVIGDGITEIPDDSFEDNENLSVVSFGKRVEKFPGISAGVAHYAFTGCPKLCHLIFNCNTVPSDIPEFSSISEITFGENVMGSNYSFSNYEITKVTFNCPTVSSWFMKNKYVKEVIIGDSVKEINHMAFYNCTSLLKAEVGKSVEVINGAFGSCSNLEEVILGDNVWKITGFCFRDCIKLSTINLPESLTYLGLETFNRCESLESLVVPNGVKNIEQYTFNGCKNLKKISLGSGVETIGYAAFSGCNNLQEFYCHAVVPPTCNGSAFSGLDQSNCKLFVPETSIDMYWGADQWMDFWNLESIPSPKEVAVSGITLDQTTATLTEGETVALTATVSPDDATDKTVTWGTSDAKVAIVENGVVTAVAAGTTTITATAGNCSATCMVIVEKKVITVSGITLDQTAATLTEGETLTLTATVIPENADNTSVTWTSSNEDVAIVSSKGKVIAMGAGTATITATANDGSGVSASCEVTVKDTVVEPEPEPEPEKPKVESGEYYLYNVNEKKFLSRGEYWGTCAVVDRYGIPFVWNAEEYSLKFLDSNVCLFETDDNNLYTDNNSTGFAFEYTEGGYLLKSMKSDRYLTIMDKAYTHQIVNVTDDAAASTLWQPMTKVEHDAIVAGYVEENYANVIAAAGLTATAGDFADYLSTLTATDMTSAIGTARFAGSAGDWTFTEVRHQDWQPAYGTDFCELWQATGSYTQTITGLAEGIYKVTVQGFERSGGWATCNTLAEKGYEISTATLSANGEETNLKSWYSGKSGESNPNNTGEAVAKFAEGLYQSEVYTYVGEDGTLTLTLCKPSHVGDNWVLFNNFTLTRYAEVDTGIDMPTANSQQPTVIYDLMGRKVENPAKGIYIVGGKKVVIK